MAARSRAWVCGRSLAGIVGSNLAESMADSCQCYLFLGRGPCDGLITRPEKSCRVWRVWMWSWNIDNKEALVYWGCCAMVKNLHAPKYSHQTLVILLRVSTRHRCYLQGVFSVFEMVRYTVVGENSHTHADALKPEFQYRMPTAQIIKHHKKYSFEYHTDCKWDSVIFTRSYWPSTNHLETQIWVQSW